MVLHFADADEVRFIKLENQATEIRKTLLGALMMAKDLWKSELEQKQEGTGIARAIKEAEEIFVDSALLDGFERLEAMLKVIHKRADGLFLLLQYIHKNKL